MALTCSGSAFKTAMMPSDKFGVLQEFRNKIITSSTFTAAVLHLDAEFKRSRDDMMMSIRRRLDICMTDLVCVHTKMHPESYSPAVRTCSRGGICRRCTASMA